MARLNLVVLRSPQLDAVKGFYQAVGLCFVPEKHGRGPDHFSARSGDVVIELYPSGKEAEAGDLRLGFTVSDIASVIARLIALGTDVPDIAERSVVVTDPDGRRVELTQGDAR